MQDKTRTLIGLLANGGKNVYFFVSRLLLVIHGVLRDSMVKYATIWAAAVEALIFAGIVYLVWLFLFPRIFMPPSKPEHIVHKPHAYHMLVVAGIVLILFLIACII